MTRKGTFDVQDITREGAMPEETVANISDFAGDAQISEQGEVGESKENKVKRALTAGGQICQWSAYGADAWMPCADTKVTLPNGVYTIESTRNDGIVFVKHALVVDNIIEFPDSQSAKVVDEIERFWDAGERFVGLGFAHRRGYLLYGPQGSGKTSLVMMAMHRVAKRGGIVFLMNNEPELFTRGLELFRRIEPVRPALCVFEDVDAILRRHNTSLVLALLDGESRIDHVLNVATTNYPEMLDKRIVARPRRFDRVIKIGMPPYHVRLLYLQKKGLDDAHAERLSKSTEGLSLAALAEILVSSKALNITEEEAIKAMRDMATAEPSSEKFGKEGRRIGIGGRIPAYTGKVEDPEDDE